jgi:hypothetical protein
MSDQITEARKHLTMLQEAAADDKKWTIVDYVREEVARQGHDITKPEGLYRVGWMLEAWGRAIARSTLRNHPSIHDVQYLGRLVEPIENAEGFRSCCVTVGGRPCPAPEDVPVLMERLWKMGQELTPLEFYRAGLEIHPFVDGNGRTFKIVLNWRNGTLHAPVFPPHDFWGRVIRNP